MIMDRYESQMQPVVVMTVVAVVYLKPQPGSLAVIGLTSYAVVDVVFLQP